MKPPNSQHMVQVLRQNMHAQISAMIPAMKAQELAFAARGEALSRFRRKYPTNGSIKPAVRMIPQAGSQQ